MPGPEDGWTPKKEMESTTDCRFLQEGKRHGVGREGGDGGSSTATCAVLE